MIDAPCKGRRNMGSSGQRKMWKCSKILKLQRNQNTEKRGKENMIKLESQWCDWIFIWFVSKPSSQLFITSKLPLFFLQLDSTPPHCFIWNKSSILGLVEGSELFSARYVYRKMQSCVILLLFDCNFIWVCILVNQLDYTLSRYVMFFDKGANILHFDGRTESLRCCEAFGSKNSWCFQCISHYFPLYFCRMKRKFYSWEECMNLREVKVLVQWLPSN